MRRIGRCHHRAPAMARGFAGERCQRPRGHDGMCRTSAGEYRFQWNDVMFTGRAAVPVEEKQG